MQLVEFSQRFNQGLWKDTDPIYQIPCITEDTLKKLKRAMKTKPDLGKLLALTNEEREELDVFAATELQAVNEACSNYPRLGVTAQVLNEGDIGLHDFIEIKVRMERKHLKENEEQGFVHSENYPHLRRERLHIMIVDSIKEQFIFSYQWEDGQGAVEEQIIKIRAMAPVKFKVAVQVTSDSYIGVQARTDLEFTVKKREEVEDQFAYHEEDLR